MRYFNKKSLLAANASAKQHHRERILSECVLLELRAQIVFPVIMHMEFSDYIRVAVVLDDMGRVGVLDITQQELLDLPILKT